MQTVLRHAPVVLALLLAGFGCPASVHKAIADYAREAKWIEPDARLAAVQALGRIHNPKVATPLSDALRDTDARVRVAAAQGLADSATAAAALPALVTALQDADPEVRQHAIAALTPLGERLVEPLLPLLNAPGVETRAVAASLLHGTQDPGARQALREALRDDAAAVRLAAARALDWRCEPAAFHCLRDALREHDPLQRQSAVVALGEGRDTRALPLLLEALHDADADVQVSALHEVALLRDARVPAVLLQALQSSDTRMSSAALAAARQRKDPELIAALQSIARTPANPQHRAAQQALAFYHDLRALTAVQNLMRENHDISERREIIAALAANDDAGATELLRFSLRDAEVTVRRAAAAALAARGEDYGLELLLDALAAPPPAGRPDDRPVLVEALGHLRAPRALHALSGLAHDHEPAVRAAAMTAIGRWLHAGEGGAGGDAAPMIGQLAAALNDPAADVRDAVFAALTGCRDPRLADAWYAVMADERFGWRAAQLLAQLHDSRALPLAASKLQNEDLPTREEAARALVAIGEPAVDTLLAALRLPDDGIRQQAAWALGEMQNAAVAPRLFALAASPEEETRTGAIEALAQGWVKEPALAKCLGQALHDDSPTIRYWAAIGLGRQHTTTADALARLLAAAHDANAHVRAAALQSLRAYPGAQVLATAAAAVHDADLAVRQVAVNTLWNTADPAVTPALTAALTDADAGVRARAADALAALKPRSAVHPLLEALGDREARVREHAVLALAALGDPKSADALQAMLRDTHPAVRAAAAWALGAMNTASLLPALTPLLDDPYPTVRAAAVAGLQRLGNRKAVLPLAGVLRNDADAGIRAKTALALGALGDVRAVPALVDALQDEEGMVATAASDALAALPPADVAPSLAITLQSTNDDARRAALAVVEQWQERGATPAALSPLIDPLLSLAQDAGPQVRLGSLTVLAHLHDSRIPDALFNAAADRDARVREFAAMALGTAGDARAVELLLAVLADTASTQRVKATVILGHLKDSRAVEGLIAALESGDLLLQHRATTALINITGKDFGGHAAQWRAWWQAHTTP